MKKTTKKQPPSATRRRQRALHKRVALHPISVLLVLCVGVCLAVATFSASAESYEVTAKVPADPLTEPAVITSPHDQDRLRTQEIVVSGTCPDKSYVKLFQNGLFSGAATCVNKTFQILTKLTVGANRLQAKVFNLTDSEGPESPAITVYYEPLATIPTKLPSTTPSGPSAGQAGGGQSAIAIALLKIVTDYRHQTHSQGEPWPWSLRITGGVAPYRVTIDWGDTQSTTLEVKDSSPFSVRHIYNDPGTYYPIVRVTDQRGSSDLMQLSADVKRRPDAAGATQTTGLLDWLRKYLWAVWPAYSVVLLMLFSFWLGEKEALRHRLRPRRIGHRPH